MNVLTKIKSVLAAALVIAVASCITVNVNFPETAVRRATDDFVKDLYQRQSAQKGKTKSTDGTMIWDLVLSSAYATDLEVSMKDPRYDKYRDSMGGRLGKLNEYMQQGALAESDDGTVKVLDKSNAAAAAAAAAENKDREGLYSTYQAHRGFNDRDMNRVKRNFFESRKAPLPSGARYFEDGKVKTK